MENLEDNLQTQEELEQDPNLEMVKDSVEENETEPLEKENPLPKRETRQEKYAKLEKSYNELRSFSDRRYNESKKQLEELTKQLEFFAPYKDALAKAIEEKKQNELADLYAKNPIEAQRRIAEEAAKAQEAALRQQYDPLKQQIEQYQNEQFVGQTINYLSQTYGEKMFEAAKEPMRDILTEVSQNAGPEAANLLARNPDALFQMAFGRVALNEIRRINGSKQVQQVNQNKATQFAKGVARPGSNGQNRVTSYENMSDAELERLHYESLLNQVKNR